MTKQEKEQIEKLLFDAPNIYEAVDGKLFIEAEYYVDLQNELFKLCGSDVGVVISKRPKYKSQIESEDKR